MTEGSFSFELRNSLSELDTLCRNLERFGGTLGLSQRTIFKVNLALEELVSNIPFNPIEAEEPDCGCPVEERLIGNLGIHLCKQFMDDLIYERRGNKNIVTLKKSVEEV
jgi:anti-sigma regulatory factor (Ser/Thr protein kinase)